MANPNPSPATRFSAENPGARRAKQKGARDRMSAAFLTALADDFDQHGVATIAQVRERDPTTYFRVVAGLMPKEAVVDLTQQNPLKEMSDAELEQMIRLCELRNRVAQQMAVQGKTIDDWPGWTYGQTQKPS